MTSIATPDEVRQRRDFVKHMLPFWLGLSRPDAGTLNAALAAFLSFAP